MKREILTYPMEPDQIRQELTYLADYLQKHGHAHCSVLFGHEWGISYYGNNHWDYEELRTADLTQRILTVESSGIGKIGADDLLITVPDLAAEFKFCHESDIHISFEEPSEIIEHFYSRWKTLGYSPAEWLAESDDRPRTRLRFN